jgi:hypothetical protein
MTKTLEQRLLDAKAELGKIDAALGRNASKLPAEVQDQFRGLVGFAGDVEHWLGLLEARAVARHLLDGLEHQADGGDLVALGAKRVKYQHVRLIGVQAYLSTTWALADRLAGLAGRILCTPAAGFDAGRPAQLVAQFIQKDRGKTTAGALYESLRQTFGWPVAISYALRNHFVHDGAQLAGMDFFDGQTAASRFLVSPDGWARIEDRAKSYGVEPTHHRAGAAWPAAPRDDLRAVLDACERESDDALGVLVGSACRSLAAHVGLVVGED